MASIAWAIVPRLSPLVPEPERPIVSGTESGATIVARVPRGSTMSAAELERLAASAHDSLSRTLGTSTVPVTVELYESLGSSCSATGSPWWVSAVVSGTTIDLALLSLLAQRNGVYAVLRTAMAELLMTPALVDRPAWVRVGAARYFAQQTRKTSESSRIRWPSDAELALAISAAAKRDAEVRAEACFAHRYVQTNDWRTVRGTSVDTPVVVVDHPRRLRVPISREGHHDHADRVG